MPKRPNPSDNGDKDEPKKARTGGSSDAPTANGDDNAGLTVKLSVAVNTSAERVSAAASRVAAAAVGVLSPTPATNKPSNTRPSPVSSSTSSSSTKSNGGSGGSNEFLKSLRSTTSSMPNREAKTPPATKKEPRVNPSTAPNNGTTAPTTPNGTTPTSKLPIVPVPHLPHDNESRLKNCLQPIMVLFLFLLNMAAVIYIASQQSWHSVLQMTSNLELNKLHNELASSHDEVNILTERMDALEQAREAREKMLADDTEVFTGLFGPMVGGGNDDLLTSEEREEWLEKLRMLEADGQLVLNQFNRNLSKFGVEGDTNRGRR